MLHVIGSKLNKVLIFYDVECDSQRCMCRSERFLGFSGDTLFKVQFSSHQLSETLNTRI